VYKSITAALWLTGLAACSGNDADAPLTERRPLLEAAGGAESLVLFVDAETGLGTVDVHDVDRQVVRFDANSRSMLWAASGDAVGGWVTDGNALSWSRGGAFRVRFGTEAGERRAYFTEAGPGTICNLEITGPDQLSIRASSETPPGP
jgi:hypothetical protein